jgi:uncharacterized protein (UPF0248 family)
MSLNLDNIDALHAATATTDYDAFVGREESLSSEESLPSRSKPASRSRAKKSRRKEQAMKSSTKASDRPLRPAQEILARLRHDPVLSLQNFTIGYLDRHAPEAMEMPLEQWKGGDVTDEDFIPLHRILWFRRNHDGVKVWDRKERLDLVFGTGRGSTENEQDAVANEPVDKDSVTREGGQLEDAGN